MPGFDDAVWVGAREWVWEERTVGMEMCVLDYIANDSKLDGSEIIKPTSQTDTKTG